MMIFSCIALAFSAIALIQAQRQIPLLNPSFIPIPLLGFGTWNLDKSNASDVVSVALETGYHHIDCAAAYGNEREVGAGIAQGLKKAGLRRSDIWVTSKLWNDHHRPDLVAKGFFKTLSDLDVDYLDLFLMHWPVGSSDFDYISTWHAMETLLLTKKVRHIGVSNFSPYQISRLIASSTMAPFAHQMELHPYLQQSDWVLWHQSHGIHVTAYSPLANANPTYHNGDKSTPPPLLENNAMKEIAKERGCTTAQVALAWGISRGASVIPKSAHASRIIENFAAPECDLTYEDFKTISRLGAKHLTRFNNPSKSWGFDLYEGLDDA